MFIGRNCLAFRLQLHARNGCPCHHLEAQAGGIRKQLLQIDQQSGVARSSPGERLHDAKSANVAQVALLHACDSQFLSLAQASSAVASHLHAHKPPSPHLGCVEAGEAQRLAVQHKPGAVCLHKVLRRLVGARRPLQAVQHTLA